MDLTLDKIFSVRNILVDIVILSCVYFIPALAHVSPFQLYLLDPMRIFLLAGFLLSRQHSNAYFLAVTIPLFSALITGHPTFFKAILIATELSINLLLFIQLINRTKLNAALLMFISIVGSKIVYYMLKFVFIEVGLIEMELIATNLWIQLATTVFVTAVFYMIWTKTRKPSGKQV